MPVAMPEEAIMLPEKEVQEMNNRKRISELEKMNAKLQAQIKLLTEKSEKSLTNEPNDDDSGERKTVNNFKTESKPLSNQGQDSEDSEKILDVDLIGVPGRASRNDIIIEADKEIKSTTTIPFTRKHPVLVQLARKFIGMMKLLKYIKWYQKELFGFSYKLTGAKFWFEEPPDQEVQTRFRMMKRKYFEILGRPPGKHAYSIQIPMVGECQPDLKDQVVRYHLHWMWKVLI
jgi:hypothetical protein